MVVTNKSCKHVDILNHCGLLHNSTVSQQSLSYAIMSGKLPPYMRWQIECRPNLGDTNINKEFQETWKSKTNTIREKILKSSVEFMDNKIGLANDKLREIRGETLMP